MPGRRRRRSESWGAMSGGRLSDEDIPQVGILPNIHMSDPNRQKQNYGVKQGHNIQNSNRNKLPSLEAESLPNNGKSAMIPLLESRVKSVEDANYSLQKEIVKLQNELSRVGTEATNFQGQSNSWSAIMNNIEASNNMISKIVSRLKEAEGTLYSEKLSIITLLNQTKQLDLTVSGLEEEMKRQRNNFECRLARLQTVVQDIQDQKVQTEKMVSTLLNDLGQEKDKMELQDSELKLIKEEIKHISKRMAEDPKGTLPSIQKENEAKIYAEESIKQIKTTFEHRLRQIEDILSYLQNRQTFLESEEKILEQRIDVRLTELTTAIAQQDHKRKQDLYKLRLTALESNHPTESEQDKVAQHIEDISNKLFQKEGQLRKEIEERFLNLEKNLYRLENMKSNFENVFWEEKEKKWTTLQISNAEKIKTIKDQQLGLQESYVKMDGNLKKLADSFAHNMNLIEKVLKAEILERNKQETQLENKMEDLLERVGLALLTLQEALGILQEDFNNEKRKADTVQLKHAEAEAEAIGVQDRVWNVESVRKAMGTLLADIHRIKEDTPEEIAKIKDDLIVWIAEIERLKDDLTTFKMKPNQDDENDTLSRNKLFIKGSDTINNIEINRWGIYQASRWMSWKQKLKILGNAKFQSRG